MLSGVGTFCLHDLQGPRCDTLADCIRFRRPRITLGGLPFVAVADFTQSGECLHGLFIVAYGPLRNSKVALGCVCIDMIATGRCK